MKQPFEIATAIRRIRAAVRPYPKAALFELADEGYDSVFEILVACILSIRTRDETTLPASRQLFARADARRDDRPDTEGNRRSHPRLHLPRSQGPADSRHRPPRRGRAWRHTALRSRRSALLSRCRSQVCQPRPRYCLRHAVHRRRCPRPSRHQSLGLRADEKPGKDHAGSHREIAAARIGSKSTSCSCRSANTSARAFRRNARRVRCWQCASK